MTRRAKQIWVVLALLAMVSFIIAWPIYNKLSLKKANAALIERTKKAVEKNPRLQADLDRAIEEDGVLTWAKANAILKKAGEKPEPED